MCVEWRGGGAGAAGTKLEVLGFPENTRYDELSTMSL